MPSEPTDDALFHDADRPSCVKMIDLFAGPGGLDVAARWLGLASVGIELDEDACKTRIAAGLGTRQANACKVELLDEFPNATILTGGPPCQTYSVAGSGAGRKALDQIYDLIKRMVNDENIDDELHSLERTGLVLQPLRWALAAIAKKRPFETIVLEQVPTVKPVWEAIAKELRKHGYEVRVEIVHTEDFGVPQTRRRAILIACLRRAAHAPEETHRRYNKRVSRSEGRSDLLPWTTMGEALPAREYSFDVVSNYGTGGNPKLRGKRRSDEPSATVTGKVRRNRIYSSGEEVDRFDPAEAGRLQTFPIDYPWSGQDPYQQIGNAIPPRVGAHILAAAIHGKRPSEESLDAAVRGTWSAVRVGEHRLELESFIRPGEVAGFLDGEGRPLVVDLGAMSAVGNC
ncbi:DNA cytosine methyltransferase [Nocardia sp. NPDC005978]|uniref:DNA cytosine methyltransferase n=1 Tax=Nocardia sp. NPDC005978 TaxID=3156725 RepID=UPI00339E67AC